MPLFSRNAFRHRFLKFLVSLCFWLFRWITEMLARLLGFKRPGHAVGIYYLQVLPEDRNRFARQMDHLVRWAVPISADHMQTLPPGRLHAIVTADDGWLSFIQNALPELKARRIPVAIFVISDHMGDNMGEQGDQIVSEAGLRALLPDIETGLVTIGSHTCSHSRVTAIDRREASRELVDSRKRLKQVIGCDVDLFCFPFGVHTPDTIGLCRLAGYKRVFDGMPAPALEDPREFLIGRVRVDPGDWMVEFHLKLVGAYDWVPWAAELKRRMLVAFRPPRDPSGGASSRRRIGTPTRTR